MINTSELFTNTPTEANFLTVYELAEELRVSPSTIYRLIRNSAFPDVIKVSHCYRIPRSDVESFIVNGGMWA